jgi:hypothetical protein
METLGGGWGRGGQRGQRLWEKRRNSEEGDSSGPCKCEGGLPGLEVFESLRMRVRANMELCLDPYIAHTCRIDPLTGKPVRSGRTG